MNQISITLAAIRALQERAAALSVQYPRFTHLLWKGTRRPADGQRALVLNDSLEMVGYWIDLEVYAGGSYLDSCVRRDASAAYERLARGAWRVLCGMVGYDLVEYFALPNTPVKRLGNSGMDNWTVFLHSWALTAEHPLVRADRWATCPRVEGVTVPLERVYAAQELLKTNPLAAAQPGPDFRMAAFLEDPSDHSWSVVDPNLFEASIHALCWLRSDALRSAGEALWKDAKWFSKATDGYLYANLLDKAYRAGRLTAEKRKGSLHYRVTQIAAEWSEVAPAIWSAVERELDGKRT